MALGSKIEKAETITILALIVVIGYALYKVGGATKDWIDRKLQSLGLETPSAYATGNLKTGNLSGEIPVDTNSFDTVGNDGKLYSCDGTTCREFTVDMGGVVKYTGRTAPQSQVVS